MARKEGTKQEAQEQDRLPPIGMAERLLLLQRRLTIVALSLVILLLCLNIGGYFADLIRILGISILLSYLFINVVDWGEKYLRNRAVAICIVYLVLIAVAVVGVLLVVPAVVYQVSTLVNTVFNEFPTWIQMLTNALTPLEERLHSAQIRVNAIDILNNVLSSIPKPEPAAIIARMSDVATATMTWSVYGLSILVVSFYFLLDGHGIKEAVLKQFPQKHRDTLNAIAVDIDATLQAFFRGQVVLALAFAGLMVVVFLALGVHYALLLGIFLALWEIVPVIGPPIGFIPAMIAVAVDGMDHIPLNRIWQLVIVILVFNGLQWVKDNVVAPRYIGDVIGLHPVTIFIAIMIGARIDGMLGIIFAIPLACVLNVLHLHFVAEARAGDEAAAQPLAANPPLAEKIEEMEPKNKPQSHGGEPAAG